MEKLPLAGRTKKRTFRPFFKLRTWWKRRRFQYLAQVDTNEDHTKDEEDNVDEGDDEVTSAADAFLPHALYFNVQEPSDRRPYPLVRTRTDESFQDSIESMDSLVDSMWDVDETSQATEVATNVRHDQFLMEHLTFLSESTRPQEVDLMYETH